METIQHKPTGSQPDRPGLSYDERLDISYFNGVDWKKLNCGGLELKHLAVQYARASGLQETGMSINEIGLMFDLLEKKGGPLNIVELGRNFACSTRLFLQHVIRHGGFLESWDLKHWGNVEETFKSQAFKVTRIQHVTPGNFDYTLACVGDLESVANIRIAHSIKTPIENEDRWVDFLLIDTEHGLEHALGEYMRWREYLRAGAMIAFHDSTLPGPRRAIEMIKEVEEMASPGAERIIREHVNECVDGYGISVLEWKG